MKSREYRNLSLQELQERLDQSRKGLYDLRVRATTKELENVSSVRMERRNIARIKQAIAEKSVEAGLVSVSKAKRKAKAS